MPPVAKPLEVGTVDIRDFLKPYEIDATAIRIEPKSESTVRMQVIRHQR